MGKEARVGDGHAKLEILERGMHKDILFKLILPSFFFYSFQRIDKKKTDRHVIEFEQRRIMGHKFFFHSGWVNTFI